MSVLTNEAVKQINYNAFYILKDHLHVYFPWAEFLSVHLKVSYTFSTLSKPFFEKKSYFKTCHSVQAYLIRGESGTSDYLTSECLVNKILIKF